MRFCTYCGKQLEDGTVCSCPGALEEQNKKQASKQLINKLKKLIVPVAILVALAIVIICMISFAKTEIDLAEYIQEPTADGLNGQGVLAYSLDKAAIYELLIADVDYTEVDEDYDEKDAAKVWEVYDLADKAISGLSITASKETNLSNGDVITITASFENTGDEKFPYHFKDVTVQYTVSGLPEGKVFDPFAEGTIDLTFSGFSGVGEAELIVTPQGEIFDYLRYDVSAVSGLSNGDVITVSVRFNSGDLAALGYYDPEVTEKSYTVDGLHEYISSAEEIPAKALEEMKQQLLSAMQIKIDDLNEDDVILQEPVVLGSFFVSTGDPSVVHKNAWYGLEAQNAVIVFGRYAVEEHSIITFDTDTLVVLAFQNCCLKEDGMLVYEDEPEDYYLDFYSIEDSVAFCQKLFDEYELIPLE